MSRAQQVTFGKTFLIHAKKTYRFIHEPETQAFIRHLGQQLVAASPDPQIHFHFYIIRSAAINAFSVPGGYVFINSGAILAARNEDELAAVIAHEISHDTQRHIPRLIAMSHKLSWAALLGMLAGVALMGSSQFESGAAAVSLTSAGVAAENLKHRRGYESEADHIGLRTMARAGFNPRAMAAFFMRLKSYNRFTSINIPESWRTHPATDIRIAEAENLASRYPNTPIRDRPAFDRAQAALMASTGSPYTGKARIAELMRHRKDPSARLYGQALADIRLNRFAHAKKILTALVQENPRVVAYRLGLASWAQAAHDYEQAIDALAQASALRPGSVWLGVLTTRALLAAGHVNRAHHLIKSWLNVQPYRPSLYRELAHIYGLRHDYLHAHEALAEAFFLEGDQKGAQDELNLAAPFATQPQALGRLKTMKVALKEGWTVPPAFP